MKVQTPPVWMVAAGILCLLAAAGAHDALHRGDYVRAAINAVLAFVVVVAGDR